MSDQVTQKETVYSNLPLWIEHDYREFLARRSLENYSQFLSDTNHPLANLLKEYEELKHGDGPTFQGFLDFLDSGKVQKSLDKQVISENINIWNAEYEVYQREQSIENPPTLEEFLKDSYGKFWRPALESYLDPLEDRDSNTDLSGFLTFVNDRRESRSTITSDEAKQGYIQGRDEDFLERLEALRKNWPPKELKGSIEELNRSKMILPFIFNRTPENPSLLNGTPEREISKRLLERSFALVCKEEGLLNGKFEIDDAEVVTSQYLKSPDGEDPINNLRQKLECAWALTALLYYDTMDGIDIINKNKGTPIYSLLVNERAAKCLAGYASVLEMVAEFVQNQSQGSRVTRSQMRSEISGALEKGNPSPEDSAFLEACKNQNKEKQSPGARALREAVADAIQDVRAIFQAAGGRG